MTLTFGLALQNDFPAHVSPASRVAELRDQARAASEAGFRSVWMMNHYLGNMQTFQPVVALAAIAEHAGDMLLGTNMFILPLRHPVDVAEDFATLDHITNGRAVAGFGMGYRSNEYESFGIPMDERVTRYEESIELIRALWSGAVVNHVGRYFQVIGQRIGIPPLRPGGPPIWVGAGVHKAGARRAARLGDAWIVPPHADAAKLRDILAFYAAEREQLGRPTADEVVVRRELLLDPDRSLARQLGLRARGATSAMYAQFEAPDTSDNFRHLTGAEGLAEVADRSYLFTDPEHTITALKELEDIGITHVVLRMQWYDLPTARMMRTLELFRDQVLPEFHAGQ